MQVSVTILVVLALGVAGCATPTLAPDPVLALPNLRVLDQGAELDVPVPVVLMGFPSEVGQALRDALLPHQVRSDYHLNNYSFLLADQNAPPIDVAPASGPYVITANYTVVEPGPADQEAFFSAVSETATPYSGITAYDANALEGWIWAKMEDWLPDHPSTLPALVLVHGKGQLAETHTYRYTLANGALDGIRAFGEHAPIFVYDLSAQEEPSPLQPITGPPPNIMYDVSTADVPALKDLVVGATHFRLLQGALYPPSLKACHAVTFVLAREASPWPDEIDREALHEALSALMAPYPVHLDIKHLHLPLDSPELHALLRADSSKAGVRWWVNENWDQFWVPHEGCEEYVSMLWYPLETQCVGTTTCGGTAGGQAMYSVQDGRRFSLSTGGPTELEWDLVHRVLAHETGHLMGLRHPHDIKDENGPPGTDEFSNVNTVMSYKTAADATGFGALETNNLHRNRAGFLLLEIQRLELDAGTDFEAGLHALSAYNWTGAAAFFERVLAQAPERASDQHPAMVWTEPFEYTLGRGAWSA